MKLDELKVKVLQKCALLVSTEAFNQAAKCGFQDTKKAAKAYVIYKICTTIHETEPIIECMMDIYCAKMVYGSLQRTLNSICTDKEQYHEEVLSTCDNPSEVWHAFRRMKYLLDNFEDELFCK